jgi:DNA-binding GntR family transcriptional regulator
MAAKSSISAKAPGNAPEMITDALRAAILQGRYRSGAPLRQDHIATEFGTSKIPVREALVQLRAEGLITFSPNRGAVVSELSADEVDEIYAMRTALETQALARAIPNLRAADLIRAQGVLEIIDAEDDQARWSELNWEFHATLYQAARMPRLLGTIEVLHNNVARYLVIYLDSLEAQPASQREHWDILDCVKRRKTTDAVEGLRLHLGRASARLAAFLENHSPADPQEKTANGRLRPHQRRKT